MSIDVIRFGFVGAGANTTSRHIPGLQAIDGVELVSVCNRSRSSSARVAQQFDIPRIYDHWRALVEAPDTNAIVIGAWPYLHYPVTLAALAAGKHVLCEARMAMNVREARAMWEASRANPQLTAQVVPSPFTLHVDKTIQQHITGGFLGELLAIEVRAHGTDFLDREGALHWRQDFELSGYNVMSLGIWYEALMRWVGEATRVMAMGRTFVRQRLDPERGGLRTVRIPEHLDVTADMACGAQLHITMSSVTGLAGANQATLFGSEGTLRFANGKLYGGRRGDEALLEIIVPLDEAEGWRVEAEFVNAIRGLEPVTHTTFADGVKYMAFTEAVAQSIGAGTAVYLPGL